MWNNFRCQKHSHGWFKPFFFYFTYIYTLLFHYYTFFLFLLSLSLFLLLLLYIFCSNSFILTNFFVRPFYWHGKISRFSQRHQIISLDNNILLSTQAFKLKYYYLNFYSLTNLSGNLVTTFFFSYHFYLLSRFYFLLLQIDRSDILNLYQ